LSYYIGSILQARDNISQYDLNALFCNSLDVLSQNTPLFKSLSRLGAVNGCRSHQAAKD